MGRDYVRDMETIRYSFQSIVWMQCEKMSSLQLKVVRPVILRSRLT